MQKTYVYDIYIYLQQYISRNCSLFRAGDKSSQRFHNESKTKPNILGKFSCHLGLYAYTILYRYQWTLILPLNVILDVFDIP